MTNAYRRSGDEDFAALLEVVVPEPPDRTFEDTATLSIGGRRVDLGFLGRLQLAAG